MGICCNFFFLFVYSSCWLHVGWQDPAGKSEEEEQMKEEKMEERVSITAIIFSRGPDVMLVRFYMIEFSPPTARRLMNGLCTRSGSCRALHAPAMSPSTWGIFCLTDRLQTNSRGVGRGGGVEKGKKKWKEKRT